MSDDLGVALQVLVPDGEAKDLLEASGADSIEVGPFKVRPSCDQLRNTVGANIVNSRNTHSRESRQLAAPSSARSRCSRLLRSPA